MNRNSTPPAMPYRSMFAMVLVALSMPASLPAALALEIPILLYHRFAPHHSLAITVDDDHVSVYTELLPLVLRHHIPLTLSIYPSAISRARQPITSTVHGRTFTAILKGGKCKHKD